MPELEGYLLADAAVWDRIFAPQNVAIAMWTGFGILTIALIVIARMRWGQAKRMSKCIV